MNTDNPFAAPLTTDSAEKPMMVVNDHQLAGRGIRLIASIVDSILLLAVFLPLYFMGLSYFDPEGLLLEAESTDTGFSMNAEASGEGFLFQLVASIVGLGVFLLINGYLLAKSGQSVAKKLFGIKIVRQDGSPASFARIVCSRIVPLWFLALIPVIGNFISFIDAVLIFRRTRLCMHDDIAGTMVVKA